jgi:hypothetical protein
VVIATCVGVWVLIENEANIIEVINPQAWAIKLFTAVINSAVF